MKLGVRSICVSRDFDEALRAAKAAGLQGIQITTREAGVFGATDDELLQFKARVEAAGLQIASCGAGPNLADPKASEQSLAQFRAILRAAAVMGHRTVTGESKALPAGISAAQGWTTCIENARAICRMAEEFDVDFCIEPGGPCLIRTTEDLERLLDAAGSERLKVNFDGGNLWSAGCDAVEAARRLAAQIGHVHVKDWSRARSAEAALGEGEVDYASILRILRDAGYAGWLVIERERSEDPLGDTARAAERLIDLCESVRQGS